MRDPLLVPAFSRLHEYAGLWAIEPNAFASYWHMALSMDLAAHISAAPPVPAPAFEIQPAKGGKASVAVLRLSGPLMKQSSSFGGTSTVAMRRLIRQAAADSAVNGLLLLVDSPGGTIAGTMDLANEVRAASRKKPVWAFIDDLGASAAYWIASQADMVYANSPTAMVGSIGTILTVYDVSQAAERDGVKALVFATGPLKGAGTPGTVVTDEQQAYFQGLVDAAQRHFDEAVRRGRSLSQAALGEVRTGGVFTATEAIERKLIDGVRSLESVIEALGAAK